MLDNTTRQRIDTARDILVGKVPDPKSQVEQITIALIYKFMDDMDEEAVEMGGKASFFSGEYEKYGWRKMFDPRLGGFDMLALYSEAITRMVENPNLPQLFRDIFKNAYLPYRDPETLKLFLKTINAFHYDHSEQLGDAFEYLLSVLGSQGDAGQFRTPRHIIDFMVEVVKPQKNETVLDPACGTAGFLIAAYKHILRENGAGRLTPDEKKRLMSNFTGYDISPDMVRLALVNLYLHGFVQPKVFEYDTLSSEERWNDYADVVLANPPFMSPKGGIRPHKRFSVQSNRSEVLFVDYMAEHLTPNGRAAIIVPEGIIFQSAGAYKQLRKYLVEQNYLWAVVSLPAGVFNPYAGVKTSILLLDRELARKSGQVLFVKVEADGYDLGAQRRKIEKDDLPEALRALNAWQQAVRSGTGDAAAQQALADCSVTALAVGKERLAEGGDYNLSGERYRENKRTGQQKWPMVALGDVCTFEYGKGLKAEDRIEGEYPVFGSNGIVGFHNQFLVEAPFIVVGRKGSAGKIHYSEKNGYPIDTTFYIKLENENFLQLKYLFSLLKSLDLENVNVQAGVPGLNRNDVYKICIPLPPLEVQREIVAEIEGYQRIIDGARQVVENWKPNIELELEEARRSAGVEAWETVKLGEVCEINPKKSEIRDLSNETMISFVPMEDLCENKIFFFPKKERRLGDVYKGYTYFRDDDILLAKVTPCFENGKSGVAKNLINGIGFGSSEFIVLRVYEKTLPEFIYWLITQSVFIKSGQQQMTGTGGLQRIPTDFVSNYRILLPPLDTQLFIVSRIEAEREMVEANRRLIEIYEAKVRRVIERVWEG